MKKQLITLIMTLMGMSSLFGSSLNVTGAEIAGIWLGKVKVTEQLEMRFAYVISKSETGALSATLNILEQKAFNIPMEKVTFENDSVIIDFSSKGIMFKGLYHADVDRITGHFSQAGKSFSLELARVDELPKTTVRAQTPQRPFPYSEEDVTFSNPAAGVELAGTLTFPKSDQPAPAVILIAGSGRNDRNGTPMGHFLLLSDYLTRNGYVVLRSDKRGVGKSTGNYGEATTADFASDINSAVDYLKTRKEVDVKRIILIGHSEGTLIAPIVAAGRKDISGLVLMGAVGIRGDELLLSQIRAMSAVTGMEQADIDTLVEQNRSYYAIIKTDESNEVKTAKIKAVNPDIPANELKMLLKPWIRYFISFDPKPFLKKVDCPVLALSGSIDLQCPPEQNLAEIAKALKAGGNKHCTVMQVPGLNHLFQTAKSGSPLEYENIDEIIAPAALESILAWVTDKR